MHSSSFVPGNPIITRPHKAQNMLRFFFLFGWTSRRCINRWESVLEMKLTRGTFEQKVFVCVCVPFSSFFGAFQCDCHENEGFVSQRHSSRERLSWQPRDGGCCAVNKQFAWASVPFKGTFSFYSDHVKNVVVKGSPLFFAHKDVRWAELEFPNMLIHESVNSKPPSSKPHNRACLRSTLFRRYIIITPQMGHN